VAAPFAGVLSDRFGRRPMIVLALGGLGAVTLGAALAPNYGVLLVLRALSVLGAAVFTPQAAAAIGTMVPVHERGRAITFVFLGWSVASVHGMPVHSYIGETFGWRWAFVLVALLAAGGAGWVWRTMPDGIKPPAMNLRAWRDVFTQPVLIAVVLVTAMSGAGQFTVFSYFAPYYRQVLGASAGEVSFLFFWFGVFGLLGNVLLSHFIDRIGAARAVAALLACMAVSLAAWPLATGVAAMSLALIPWAIGCFSSNSAQQARLGIAAPALAPALMALNTSAIYLGQAAGAAGGAALLATSGFALLHWVALAWMLAAIGLSLWAGTRTRAPVAAA
jgi:predicted MFS family arabinose efflux permease